MIQGSFTGDVINPIIDARLNLSLTANALAKRLGLSRQYIQRAEAGTYASLNPALLRWVANAQSISTASVERRYTQFQEATRRATIEVVNPHKLTRQADNRERGYVLFERWRSGYWPSVVAFSNAFCLHSDTIGSYEEGIRKSMPTVIRDVLLNFDLMDKDFDEFAPEPDPLRAPLTA